MDREKLGRVVHDAWVKWCPEQARKLAVEVLALESETEALRATEVKP